MGNNTNTDAGGITFGTDTSLYRSNENELTTGGALTVTGLLTGQAGLTVIGGAINLNNADGAFNTAINSGTSAGTISIGNALSTGFTLENATGTGHRRQWR